MAQFARPDSDITIGSGWDTTDSGPNFYSYIDETSVNTADYVYKALSGSEDQIIVGLSNVTDPTSSSGHVVRMGWANVNNAGTTVAHKAYLRQNTTVIASGTIRSGDGATGNGTGSFTLSSGEADSITDYTDLNLRLTTQRTAGGGTNEVRITWAELEVPNASTNITVSPPAGTADHVTGLAAVGVVEAVVTSTNIAVAGLSPAFVGQNPNTSVDAGSTNIAVAGYSITVTGSASVSPPTGTVSVLGGDATISITQSYSDIVLGDTPEAYWPLNEPSGTNVEDTVGSVDLTWAGSPSLNQSPLMVNGSSPVSALINTTSDYARNTSADAIALAVDSANATSLELWFKIPSHASYSTGVLASLATYTSSVTANVMVNASVTTSGSNKRLRTTVNGQFLDHSFLTENTRYHLVVTHNGSTRKVYLNGAEVDSDTDAQNFIRNTVRVFTINGNVATNGTASSKGAAWIIDDVAIYAYALSSTQVGVHYTSGSSESTVSAVVSADPGTASVSGQSASVSTSLTTTVTIDNTANIAVQALVPSVSDGTTVNISVTQSGFSVTAPTVTVTAGGSVTQTVTNVGTSEAVGYDIALLISADDLAFAFVDPGETGFTALDVTEISSFTLGSLFNSSEKVSGFRLANRSPSNATTFDISAVGNNALITDSVEFSADKQTWSSSLITDAVPINGLSDVIYFKVTIPSNAFTGNASFLINVEQHDA